LRSVRLVNVDLGIDDRHRGSSSMAKRMRQARWDFLSPFGERADEGSPPTCLSERLNPTPPSLSLWEREPTEFVARRAKNQIALPNCLFGISRVHFAFYNGFSPRIA